MMRWGRVTAAVSLLAVGFLLALDLAGLIDSWKWLYTAWPAVFILLGVELIVLQAVARSRNRKMRFSWGGMLGAALLIGLAVLLVHGDRIKEAAGLDLHWIGIGAWIDGRKGEPVDLAPVFAPVSAEASGVVIRHKAGNITVRQGGDAGELAVRAVAWPEGFGKNAEKTVRDIRLQVRETGERLEVVVDVPSRRYLWWLYMPAVDLEVTLPPGADLSVEAETAAGSIEAGPLGSDARLKTLDGNITLTAIRGSVFAETLNGDVAASDVEGNAELKTTNGDVSASDVKGNAKLNSTNGDIRAIRISGQADGHTVNGEIAIDTAGGGVRAHTVNGDITIAGTVLAGDWEAKSMHGTIVLRLPEGADAEIRAKHRFGGLKSDFPLRTEQNAAEGTLGAGTHRVFAETNGDIHIRRNGTSASADGEPAGPGFH